MLDHLENLKSGDWRPSDKRCEDGKRAWRVVIRWDKIKSVFKDGICKQHPHSGHHHEWRCWGTGTRHSACQWYIPEAPSRSGTERRQPATAGCARGTAGCCCSPSGEGHLLGCLQVTLPASQEVGHRDCQRLDDKGSGASRIISSELPFSSSNIWYHGNVIWDQRSTLTWLHQTRNATSDRGEISRALSGKGKADQAEFHLHSFILMLTC